MRLKKVGREIDVGASAVDAQLASQAGITVKELHIEFGLHTIAEVNEAIERWGGAFRSHIGETESSLPPLREGPEIGGYTARREGYEYDMEESLRKAKKKLDEKIGQEG
ncbi:hypothetical protein HY411_01000 [Candidatus Gottesmanbacteria bacterium]|nr:hypothetical protein [Candidatus Gottesmanbacteria bacterium]